MPRKKILNSNKYCYHVTSRTNNKEWFSITPTRAWDLFSYFLYYSDFAYNLHIHAFVMMNNHFHLLASAPNENISDILQRFLTETSKAINSESGRVNHVFGGRAKITMVTNAYHYAHTIKYIYQNPLRARICNSVEEYMFSTLPGLIGKAHLLIPIKECQNGLDCLVPTEISHYLNWLNTRYNLEDERSIEMALKKSEFKFVSKKTSHSKSRLQNSIW